MMSRACPEPWSPGSPGAHPAELGELGELLADGVEDGDGVAGQSVLDRQTAAGVARPSGRPPGPRRGAPASGREPSPPAGAGAGLGLGFAAAVNPMQAERGAGPPGSPRPARPRRRAARSTAPTARAQPRLPRRGVRGTDGTDDTEGAPAAAAATPQHVVAEGEPLEQRSSRGVPECRVRDCEPGGCTPGPAREAVSPGGRVGLGVGHVREPRDVCGGAVRSRSGASWPRPPRAHR